MNGMSRARRRFAIRMECTAVLNADTAGGGGGDPTPPEGFAFVVNGNGDYFVTQGGDYTVQEIV